MGLGLQRIRYATELQSISVEHLSGILCSIGYRVLSKLIIRGCLHVLDITFAATKGKRHQRLLTEVGGAATTTPNPSKVRPTSILYIYEFMRINGSQMHMVDNSTLTTLLVDSFQPHHNFACTSSIAWSAGYVQVSLSLTTRRMGISCEKLHLPWRGRT